MRIDFSTRSYLILNTWRFVTRNKIDIWSKSSEYRSKLSQYNTEKAFTEQQLKKYEGLLNEMPQEKDLSNAEESPRSGTMNKRFHTQSSETLVRNSTKYQKQNSSEEAILTIHIQS